MEMMYVDVFVEKIGRYLSSEISALVAVTELQILECFVTSLKPHEN